MIQVDFSPIGLIWWVRGAVWHIWFWLGKRERMRWELANQMIAFMIAFSMFPWNQVSSLVLCSKHPKLNYRCKTELFSPKSEIFQKLASALEQHAPKKKHVIFNWKKDIIKKIFFFKFFKIFFFQNPFLPYYTQIIKKICQKLLLFSYFSYR